MHQVFFVHLWVFRSIIYKEQFGEVFHFVSDLVNLILGPLEHGNSGTRALQALPKHGFNSIRAHLHSFLSMTLLDQGRCESSGGNSTYKVTMNIFQRSHQSRVWIPYPTQRICWAPCTTRQVLLLWLITW